MRGRKEGAKDKVKIGTKEYDATILDVTAYDCGMATTKIKVWSCRDVPGGEPRTEEITSIGKIVTVVTSFQTK